MYILTHTCFSPLPPPHPPRCASALNAGFLELNTLPYCEACYPSAAGLPVCEGCHSHLTGQCVSMADKTWHKV